MLTSIHTNVPPSMPRRRPDTQFRFGPTIWVSESATNIAMHRIRRHSLVLFRSSSSLTFRAISHARSCRNTLHPCFFGDHQAWASCATSRFFEYPLSLALSREGCSRSHGIEDSGQNTTPGSRPTLRQGAACNALGVADIP